MRTLLAVQLRQSLTPGVAGCAQVRVTCMAADRAFETRLTAACGRSHRIEGGESANEYRSVADGTIAPTVNDDDATL